MLIIKCAFCKAKIFRYKKIGKGQVLRCYKDRINRVYQGQISDDELVCGKCGGRIGRVEDHKIKMDQNAFTYSGKKD
ncbi:hypothetical protein [Natranaerobius thermophilus]|uniref:Uncharacterized protein n=1 Tax=Natranaerobius thermophilus (strain ATCC BAA-1301 / DSM 18059 / JW/NM-WN-LF) TaxID=457570 RepID=B2A2W5_NATTJ|nr:hypothetical protein [Natranaerobius thermophilus]ACB86333.1 conserved hypothetical protein [Natranaerobius thermophilus JW/NM-WN-LF]